MVKVVAVTPSTRSHEMISDVSEVETIDSDNAASAKGLQHEYNTIKYPKTYLSQQ